MERRLMKTKTNLLSSILKSIAVIAIFAAAVSISWTVVKADTEIADTEIVEADVSTPSSNCVFLGQIGTYIVNDQAVLDRINEIRYEACTEGDVPDPRNPSRMLTESDYVPVKWSTNLESIARIRASEASLTIAHARLNGKTIWTVTSNGIGSNAECLTWWSNYSNSPVTGIDNFYSEKSNWVNQVSGTVTGHYTAMINPNYTYVGTGYLNSTNARYRNCLALELTSTSSSLNQTMQDGTGLIMQKLDVAKSNINGYTASGTTTIAIDETTEFTAKASVNASGYTVSMFVIGDITYKSSDPSVVKVTDDGKLVGVSLGNADITIYADGTEISTTTVTVACQHKNTEVKDAVEATCTTKGYSGDTICTSCGETIKTGSEIAALGHKAVKDAAVAATCTETGLTEGSHCSVCNEIITAQEEVPALGHSVLISNAVDPSCTTTGLTEGSSCSVCGEILTEQQEVPALGHSYENYVCIRCGAEDPDKPAAEPDPDPVTPDPDSTPDPDPVTPDPTPDPDPVTPDPTPSVDPEDPSSDPTPVTPDPTPSVDPVDPTPDPTPVTPDPTPSVDPEDPTPTPSGYDKTLVKTADGRYAYYENGTINTSKTGFVEYSGSKFLVVKGYVSTESDGLINDPDNKSDWYYCSAGQVCNVTQLVQYDGEWFYVTNGKLDTTFSGLVSYDGSKFIVAAGQIQTGVNGLWQNAKSLGGDGKWYYFANGQAQTQYSGLAYYDGAWFFVRSGALAEDYVGYVYYDGVWFYVDHGNMII